MIHFFTTVLIYLCVSYLLYQVLKKYSATQSYIKQLLLEQIRMQKIVNIMVLSSHDLFVRNTFHKLINMPLNEVEAVDIKKLYTQCAVDTLQEIRLKIKRDLDEFKLAFPGERLDTVAGLENLMTLICTVDESSSTDYIQQIFMEVTIGLKNLC